LNRLSPYNRIALIALAIYAALQVYCIHQLSINHDEGLFASYGVSLLKGERNKDVVLFDSKLPITAVNMIPRAVEQVANPGLSRSWPESTIDIIRGRYISLLVSILLGLLIFKWTRELFSPAAAVASLLLYLICPNFLAHGIFVSSDIFACFFITAAFYYLWKFCNKGEMKSFVLMSLAVALGQISKFSLFHLFILIPVALLANRIFNRNNNQPRAAGKKTILQIFLFLFINWIVISAAHLFRDFIIGVFPQFPVPLPSSYVRSMDAVMYFDHLGGGEPGSLNGPSFLLGKSSRFGFWYYYFVVIFFKVPITILIFWIGSLFLSVKNISQQRFSGMIFSCFCLSCISWFTLISFTTRNLASGM
jgi:4-amino-4-deoxy-L-arabinose transferase-like glycosyltransferase